MTGIQEGMAHALNLLVGLIALAGAGVETEVPAARAERLVYNTAELEQLGSSVYDEMVGLGPIEPLLKDDALAILKELRYVRPNTSAERLKQIEKDAEKRAIETIQDGKPSTAFMKFGDTIRIEMKDKNGQSLFGAIDQQIVGLDSPAA